MSYTIGVVAYDNSTMAVKAVQCINDAIRSGAPTPRKIIAIDNGKNIAWNAAGVEIHRPHYNLGCAAAWNRIIDLSDGLPSIIINEDVSLTADVIRKLLEPDMPYAFCGGYHCFRISSKMNPDEPEFDPAYWPTHYEDTDHQTRLRVNNATGGAELGYIVEHVSGATIRNHHHWVAPFGIRNRALFEWKWGGPPDSQELWYDPEHADAAAFELLYRSRQASDINEHLTFIRDECVGMERIVEFGTRDANSSVAFMAAKPREFIAYDIGHRESAEILYTLSAKTAVRLINSDSLDADFDWTDVLFIDTLHVSSQLKAELELHGNKTRKKIILHDTEIYGQKDEHGGPGLMQAVNDFISINPHWRISCHRKNNNGLTVLTRNDA